ncbi:hypothetical protein AAZV13_13G323400 [Glycine max]
MSTLCMAENMKEVEVEDGYVLKEEIHLTVLKTSLFFAGDGFSVYDCKGQLVFRVDSYGPDTRDIDELVLMDPNGRCLLTVRRKVRNLFSNFSALILYIIILIDMRSSGRVCINGGKYQIEGCFSQRCCTVFNVTKESVAEISRKVDPTTSVVLGKEVFSLCVKPGFDAAFAMGFVLVLDQISGEDYVDNIATTEPTVHPATED